MGDRTRTTRVCEGGIGIEGQSRGDDGGKLHVGLGSRVVLHQRQQQTS
jgi:hypothetical protein